MKKVIITFFVISLLLAGLNVYVYLGMQESINKYEETMNKNNEYKNEQIENDKEIIKLKNELNNIKNNNLENNKEYKIWTNLIDTMKKFLNQ